MNPETNTESLAHSLSLSEKTEELATEIFPHILASDKVALSAFLTCISDVEFFGAKWIAAVPHRFWNEDLHKHTLDEIRHGQLTQEASREIRSHFSNQEILREFAISTQMIKLTQDYLGLLSMRAFRPVRRRLGEGWFEPAYVILSFLIERRLMKIYPYLARHAASEKVQSLAKNLIADEKEHLSSINEKITDRLDLSGLLRTDLIELEKELAQQWLEGAAIVANRS